MNEEIKEIKRFVIEQMSKADWHLEDTIYKSEYIHIYSDFKTILKK
jgi:hypothetical protein